MRITIKVVIFDCQNLLKIVKDLRKHEMPYPLTYHIECMRINVKTDNCFTSVALYTISLKSSLTVVIKPYEIAKICLK